MLLKCTKQFSSLFLTKSGAQLHLIWSYKIKLLAWADLG